MSRVGKYPVEIPQGVQVAVAGCLLTAKGRLGELSLTLTDAVEARVEGNRVTVAPRNETQRSRMMWGTTRATSPTWYAASRPASPGRWRSPGPATGPPCRARTW